MEITYLHSDGLPKDTIILQTEGSPIALAPPNNTEKWKVELKVNTRYLEEYAAGAREVWLVSAHRT